MHVEERSFNSSGPIERDDIKVSTKYFWCQWEQPRETPRDHDNPVVHTRYCIPRWRNATRPAPWALKLDSPDTSHLLKHTHLNAEHHMTPKQLQLDTASQCYITKQNVTGGGWYKNLLQCTPNINKQCPLSNRHQHFFDWSQITTGTWLWKFILLLIMAEDAYLGTKQWAEWGLSVTVRRLHLIHWSEQIHAANTH